MTDQPLYSTNEHGDIRQEPTLFDQEGHKMTEVGCAKCGATDIPLIGHEPCPGPSWQPRTNLLVWSCPERRTHEPHDYEELGLMRGVRHCPGVFDQGCPYCAALPDEACVNPDGKPVSDHATRRNLTQKIQFQP